MKLDEMIIKIGRKTKVDDVTARKVIREVLASIREEILASDAESRVTVPMLGTFVIRPGKDAAGRSRIVLNLLPRESDRKATAEAD